MLNISYRSSLLEELCSIGELVSFSSSASNTGMLSSMAVKLIIEYAISSEIIT